MNDYVFIEAEAHRYAEEAVRALKISSENCFSAQSGIPNWGAKNLPKFARGKPTSQSSNLLNEIRQRKQKQSIVETDENDDEQTDRQALALIKELKNYLTVGTNRSGRATTNDIIEHFQDKFKSQPHLVPKFKSLLKRIADLKRTPSGMGFWLLKDEFRTTEQ